MLTQSTMTLKMNLLLSRVITAHTIPIIEGLHWTQSNPLKKFVMHIFATYLVCLEDLLRSCIWNEIFLWFCLSPKKVQYKLIMIITQFTVFPLDRFSESLMIEFHLPINYYYYYYYSFQIFWTEIFVCKGCIPFEVHAPKNLPFYI